MDFHKLSLIELKKHIQEKRVSPEELVSYFKERIEKINPTLNAIHTPVDNESFDEAKKDSALYGIPFTMKDTYVTKGIRTTAGSNVLKDYIPQYDATVYKRLKESGAILIGKTNCDAWGHGSSTENSDFGVTKNPWNTDYVAGGSSGGSAASVAKGLSAFDIGEDTGGSIRLPASFCSVVGLKVTYGLVSRYGSIAYASSLDTVGPITKTVEDCAYILELIAGNDEQDATTHQISPPKYTKSLKKSIRGMRVGLPREYFYDQQIWDKDVPIVTDEVVRILEKQLECKIEKISLPHTKYAVSTYYLISTSETSSNLGRFDGIRYGDSRSAFGAEAKRRIMLGTFTLSAGYYDAYYKKATKVRTLIKQDFEEAFKKVDIILAPVSPTPAFKIGEKVNDPLQMYLSDIFTIPVNLAGIPALSLPVGFSKNELPIGVQFIGNYLEEERLLNVGYQFERMRGELPLLD